MHKVLFMYTNRIDYMIEMYIWFNALTLWMSIKFISHKTSKFVLRSSVMDIEVFAKLIL